MLRLVRGCPLLNDVDWTWESRLSPIEDGANIDAINELLKSRGAKDQYRPFVEFGPSTRGRPDPVEESDSESESGED